MIILCMQYRLDLLIKGKYRLLFYIKFCITIVLKFEVGKHSFYGEMWLFSSVSCGNVVR